MVYCTVAKNPDSSLTDIARNTGMDPAVTESSLSRLEHALLISKSGGLYRVASVGESILRCRLRYDQKLPLVFEDGVIRVRNNREE